MNISEYLRMVISVGGGWIESCLVWPIVIVMNKQFLHYSSECGYCTVVYLNCWTKNMQQFD